MGKVQEKSLWSQVYSDIVKKNVLKMLIYMAKKMDE